MSFDYHLFVQINSLAGHVHLLDVFMLAFTRWGFLLYGLALAALWFQRTRPEQRGLRRKGVLKVCFSAAIALGLNQLIGLLYFRPRPFATHEVTLLLDRSPDPSFPSDHATGASSVNASVMRVHKGWGILLTPLSLIIIFSRVYCGTHYPLDVVGGAATGLLGSHLANKLWPYMDSTADKAIALVEGFTRRSAGV